MCLVARSEQLLEECDCTLHCTTALSAPSQCSVLLQGMALQQGCKTLQQGGRGKVKELGQEQGTGAGAGAGAGAGVMVPSIT